MEFDFKRTFKTETFDFARTPLNSKQDNPEYDDGYYVATKAHTSEVVGEISVHGTLIHKLSPSLHLSDLVEIVSFMRAIFDVNCRKGAESYARTQQKRRDGVPLSEVIEALK
jgi:hypothetical protein